MKPKKLVLCALFTALIAVGAFMRIPTPPVPITLQSFFVMMAGLLLGGRLGALSSIAYVAMGLLGLPVFTEGGGLSYILKPSFGYLLGFIAAAYITGQIANRRDAPGYRRLFAAAFAGLFTLYLVGMIYCYCISNFYLGVPMGLRALFYHCFLLIIPGDSVLCILGVILGKRLIPILHRKGMR